MVVLVGAARSGPGRRGRWRVAAAGATGGLGASAGLRSDPLGSSLGQRWVARGDGSNLLGCCIDVGRDGVVAVHGGGARRFAAAARQAPASGCWRAARVDAPGSSSGGKMWSFRRLASLAECTVPIRCRCSPGAKVGRCRGRRSRGDGSDGWSRCSWAARHRQGCRTSTWSAPASPLLRLACSLIDLVGSIASAFLAVGACRLVHILQPWRAYGASCFLGGGLGGGSCGACGLSLLLRCGRLATMAVWATWWLALW